MIARGSDAGPSGVAVGTFMRTAAFPAYASARGANHFSSGPFNDDVHVVESYRATPKIHRGEIMGYKGASNATLDGVITSGDPSWTDSHWN